VDRFDVIIIGMGVGGEAAAGRLLAAGQRVAVVERELIGGECAYWACIPSKTLLRAPEARAEAARAAGVGTPALDWPELRDYHDYMVRHLDDAAQVRGYQEQGATVIKGTARITGPGQVEAGGELLEADHVVIAAGSAPVRPDIDGLDQVPVWTNREATNVRDIPGRVLLIGGSAVGVELGQFYARMGAQVTIVQRADRLVDREDPRVGELAREALAADGVTIRTGHTASRARPAGGGAVITLDDGTETETDVVILGTGRRPVIAGLGLKAAGITPGARGEIRVDDHCRAGDGLWAIGDVTGISLFTHVAMYQGRVVASNILGRDRAASYHGIPRVIFADPETPPSASQPPRRARPASTSRRPRSPWPTRSTGPGPTSATPADTSGCSPTAAAASWPGRGRSRRWPASGSTRPRWPSAPRSPSTRCSTRSPSTPPTARPTSPRWSSSPCRERPAVTLPCAREVADLAQTTQDAAAG